MTSFAFQPPATPILFRNAGRDYARGLVRRGFLPAGSIWLPGDRERRPESGDLYAPDPDWKAPRAVGAVGAGDIKGER